MEADVVENKRFSLNGTYKIMTGTDISYSSILNKFSIIVL